MRMVEWSPVRVIRKRFVTPQHNYLALAQKASDVLIQKQFGLLSAESVNHIRYSMPGLWKCKFPLEPPSRRDQADGYRLYQGLYDDVLLM